MKKLVIFNWKMIPSTLKAAKSLFELIQADAGLMRNKAEIIVSPPVIYISELLKIKNLKLKISSQNVFWETEGAFTGEISPKMLKNLGVKYVIIGHSERRQHLNETDEMVNKKVLAALKAGLKVILCIGEPASVRHQASGIKKAKEYIRSQLQKDLSGIKNWKLEIKNLVIAYEPIWAISSSKSTKQDTPEDAEEMAKFIKNFFRVSYRASHVAVLYGGSVNSKNILSFINKKEIDGALIGRASVEKNELKKILGKIR